MRYYYEPPEYNTSMYGEIYICNHLVYDRCTLFRIRKKGLAVVQQRYREIDKSTYWSEIDLHWIDCLYLHTNSNYICVEGVNSYIRRTLNNCIKNGYKIDKFTSHAFRDTFATKAIENGMQPETLQRILGHSNIAMTMNLYYHLSDEKKYNEMQLIDKAFIDV